MGINYQKMRDADDLFTELSRQIQEKDPRINFKTEPNIDSLSRAIYAGFADSVVEKGADGVYRLVDASGHLQIGRDSVLSASKPKYFVTFSLNPKEKDGSPILNRFANLNHPIPEGIFNEKKQEDKAKTDAAKKEKVESSQAKAPADKEEKKEEKKKEEKKEEKSAPVKKPSIWQRFKNWLSWIFLGKKKE